MERGKQIQTVAINRGLFLVRYAAAEDKKRPPKVKVSPHPTSTKVVSFLLHPDHNEAVLWQPETCLVVRALAPGKLAVEVLPLQEGGSVAATVRIEPLSQGTVVAKRGKATHQHAFQPWRIAYPRPRQRLRAMLPSMPMNGSRVPRRHHGSREYQ